MAQPPGAPPPLQSPYAPPDQQDAKPPIDNRSMSNNYRSQEAQGVRAQYSDNASPQGTNPPSCSGVQASSPHAATSGPYIKSGYAHHGMPYTPQPPSSSQPWSAHGIATTSHHDKTSGSYITRGPHNGMPHASQPGPVEGVVSPSHYGQTSSPHVLGGQYFTNGQQIKSEFGHHASPPTPHLLPVQGMMSPSRSGQIPSPHVAGGQYNARSPPIKKEFTHQVTAPNSQSRPVQGGVSPSAYGQARNQQTPVGQQGIIPMLQVQTQTSPAQAPPYAKYLERPVANPGAYDPQYSTAQQSAHRKAQGQQRNHGMPHTHQHMQGSRQPNMVPVPPYPVSQRPTTGDKRTQSSDECSLYKKVRLGNGLVRIPTPQQHSKPQVPNTQASKTPESAGTQLLNALAVVSPQIPQYHRQSPIALPDSRLPLRDRIKRYMTDRQPQQQRKSSAAIAALSHRMILAKILLNVDIKTVLLSQRVSKEWHICINNSIHVCRHVWLNVMQPWVYGIEPFMTDPDYIDPLIGRLREYLDLFFYFEEATKTWKIMYNPTGPDSVGSLERLMANPRATWMKMASMRNVSQYLRWKVGCHRNGKELWFDFGVQKNPPSVGTLMEKIATMRKAGS